MSLTIFMGHGCGPYDMVTFSTISNTPGYCPSDLQSDVHTIWHKWGKETNPTDIPLNRRQRSSLNAWIKYWLRTITIKVGHYDVRWICETKRWYFGAFMAFRKHTWFEWNAVIPVIYEWIFDDNIVAAINIPPIRVVRAVNGSGYGVDGDVVVNNVFSLINLDQITQTILLL